MTAKYALSALLGRYFEAALGEAREASGSSDQSVISALSNRDNGAEAREIARNTLAQWIRLYKVHRVKWSPGTNDDWPVLVETSADEQPTFADAVAETAITLFDDPEHATLETQEAFSRLRVAIGELYLRRTGQERQFLSLTSKVLWCFQPRRTPIYDQFAYRAVVFLAKLYKAFETPAPYSVETEDNRYPYQGDAPNVAKWDSLSQADKDTWWYGDFLCSHQILFELCKDEIEQRLKQEPRPNHLDALRIFDKILWLLGNEEQDYSLLLLPTLTRPS